MSKRTSSAANGAQAKLDSGDSITGPLCTRPLPPPNHTLQQPTNPPRRSRHPEKRPEPPRRRRGPLLPHQGDAPRRSHHRDERYAPQPFPHSPPSAKLTPSSPAPRPLRNPLHLLLPPLLRRRPNLAHQPLGGPLPPPPRPILRLLRRQSRPLAPQVQPHGPRTRFPCRPRTSPSTPNPPFLHTQTNPPSPSRSPSASPPPSSPSPSASAPPSTTCAWPSSCSAGSRAWRAST